jgi:GntR family transcriptional regulator / MocR family aminotransferase
MAISTGPIFELPIKVPPRGSRSRMRALHDQLRAAIIDGRLQAGLLMPPTRALASELGISRNAVVAAYELLLGEGYLTSRQGAGTYVARVLSRGSSRSNPPPSHTRDSRLNAFWRRPGAPLIGNGPPHPPRFNFRLGVPDKTLFPFETWRRLSARALRSFSKTPAGEVELQGSRRLREEISRHVSLARAVACEPDDIVVTTGAQQAFDLIARILVTPGKTVAAVEEPGYPASRGVFTLAGARIAPIRVDDEGLVVERLPASTRIVCVTPSHQYPLGSVMSLRRRASLLEFARKHGAAVIEDDYDGEYRFGGGPLDALQTLDRAGCVFYVGTFSKCLFRELRLGFIVAPAWARQQLVSAKAFSDFDCPVHSQDTLATFIAEGHLARHVRKMRRVYDERRQLLLKKLSEDFGDLLEPLPSASGLHLTAYAKSVADEERILEQATQQSIKLTSLRRFYAGRSQRPGIVLGYGALDSETMAEALARLRRALGRPGARSASARRS